MATLTKEVEKSGFATPPFPQPQQEVPGCEGDMRPAADHGEESYRGTGRLKDKVALVTGGDSGIGRAVCLAFAREGADVAISYLSEFADADVTSKHVIDAGRSSLLLQGDLTTREACADAIEKTVARFGRIDILVNNAAYQQSYAELEDIPDEEFDRVVKTNLYATYRLTQLAVPHMREGGIILNTTSIQSVDPSPGLLPYAMTKGGISNMTLSLAQWLAERGIRVNAVAPGPVWTPLIPATLPPDKVKHFGENTLFKRPAQPAELAPVYVFLASAAASYVTGEIYGVTGGRMQL